MIDLDLKKNDHHLTNSSKIQVKKGLKYTASSEFIGIAGANYMGSKLRIYGDDAIIIAAKEVQLGLAK